MHKLRGTVRGNTFAKVAFGLAVGLLVVAPPTARPGGAAEANLQVCNGHFALCAASTCTPTGNQIAVHTLTGPDANFPEADCTCPVFLGSSIANLSGGDMQGSCAPPGTGQIWSSYQAKHAIPQAITNWVPTLPEAAAPVLRCPASLNLGNQYAQCFSFSCDSETYINNVPVVTCHCAIGATTAGLPSSSQSSFTTQAGQGNQQICFEYPVGNMISITPSSRP